MKRPFLITLIVIIAAFLLNGCDSGSFIPPLPGGGNYDEENSEIAYFKVLPSKIEMQVNQSYKFTVKAYNSDRKEVKIDLSNLQWAADYQCIGCGKVWKISPTRNSLQTTFTPLEKGRYRVWVKYKGLFEKNADVLVK